MTAGELLDESGSLLALARAYPERLDQTFERELPGGARLSGTDAAILEITPAEASATWLVLSTGVHGNETAPMEILDRMVADILAGKLQVTVNLLLLIGNPPAMIRQRRELNHNLNRLFAGKHLDLDDSQDPEGQRAALLEARVQRFFDGSAPEDQKLHYDLHTALRASRHEKFVVYPFLHDRPRDVAQIRQWMAGGVNTFLLSHQPAPTFSYFSSTACGAHGFTVELGKVRPFGENRLEDFAEAEAMLRKLISGAPGDTWAVDLNDGNFYQVVGEVTRETEDFRLHLASDAANFTTFDQGYLLAEDGDRKYRVEQDGDAIVFPNPNVAIGHRAGLVVRRIKAGDLNKPDAAN